MKKLSLLIALALLVSIGGVYATWNYAMGDAASVDAYLDGGSIPEGTTAVCIGSSTAKMLKKYGDYEKITAETFNVDGVVEIILKEVGK